MDSNKKKTEKKALLRSAAAPAAPSRERLERFIAGKYGDDVKLVWEEDPQLADGFLLQVGTDVYDWTLEGRLRQFKRQLDQLHPRRDAIIPLVKEAVENWVPEATPEEVGQVVAVGDTDPVENLELQESTLEAVKKGMYGYTQPGGSVYSAFRNCVVTAGAKTGTSELGGDQTENGVFVCFAPYDDPEIAVAIVIEHATWGSNLATTGVDILNAYFTADETGSAVTGENQLLP